ncbi:hypothetical protein BG006_003990 [Podila minutissima]|uniref:Uncharacterized protein n=1 Tax=Podila minutissima TaxID=64525 RepID=A0A9P5STP9_9FUNG|nr:hypothetical protein BG006_003990 [Podila minutissima]
MKQDQSYNILFVMLLMILAVVLRGTAATPLTIHLPPPPTPPCQSACNSDFYKCISPPANCQEEFDQCMAKC